MHRCEVGPLKIIQGDRRIDEKAEEALSLCDFEEGCEVVLSSNAEVAELRHMEVPEDLGGHRVEFMERASASPAASGRAGYTSRASRRREFETDDDPD